jgi:hypothetical protein
MDMMGLQIAVDKVLRRGKRIVSRSPPSQSLLDPDIMDPSMLVTRSLLNQFQFEMEVSAFY